MESNYQWNLDCDGNQQTVQIFAAFGGKKALGTHYIHTHMYTIKNVAGFWKTYHLHTRQIK